MSKCRICASAKKSIHFIFIRKVNCPPAKLGLDPLPYTKFVPSSQPGPKTCRSLTHTVQKRLSYPEVLELAVANAENISPVG